jgi:hypothetical protein
MTGRGQLQEVLRVNTTVTSLNLRENNLGEGGGPRAIAEALRVNHTLQTLYLWSNNLGHDGAQAIAEALRVEYHGDFAQPWLE